MAPKTRGISEHRTGVDSGIRELDPILHGSLQVLSKIESLLHQRSKVGLPKEFSFQQASSLVDSLYGDDLEAFLRWVSWMILIQHMLNKAAFGGPHVVDITFMICPA